MIDRTRNDDSATLPPELAALDEELSSLTIEERPSFGPELLAELERAWEEMPPGSSFVGHRQLIAAGVGALLIAALAVPQARASLAVLLPWSEAAEVAEIPEIVEIPEPEPPVSVPILPAPAPRVGPSVAVGSAPPVPAPVVAAASLGPVLASVSAAPANLVDRLPEILDRYPVRRAVREHYPEELHAAGIGGTVAVKLWVMDDGGTDNITVDRSSGLLELDEAALRVAHELEFLPSRRNGVAVGSWVTFDVIFDAMDDSAPVVPEPIDEVPAPTDLVMPLPDDLTPGVYLTPPPTRFEAQKLLSEALGFDGESGSRWGGQLAALLEGQPPPDELPNTWRREATVALEAALGEAPDNPAPVLALARIRRSQGLDGEARRLFEEGARRASLDDKVSLSLRAEALYELGQTIRSEWRAYADLGRLSAESLEGAVCEAAPALRRTGKFATADELSMLNEVCPEELGRVMAREFEGLPATTGTTRDDMLRAFRLAVEAEPTHPGANVEILLDLADQRRWEALLDQSERFVWESQGHPHGLLLTGLALERLGRAEQALERFEVAMKGLDEADVASLLDVSMLVESPENRRLSTSNGPGSFWRELDPILTTEVNERYVEHLARTTYAFLRYEDTMSDPARVWIRYGRPDAVRTVGEDAHVRTEFWDYGVGPDVAFRRPASSVRMELTSESRTHMEELLSVMPHLYNRRPLREIRTLQGQIGRFRGPRGSLELEISTEIPEELLAEGDLVGSVFLLGARGERVSSTRTRVPISPGPFKLRTQAPLEAEQIVVELYSAEAGVAASLREPVAFDDHDREPKVSDLLVLNAADPAPDEVRRTAAWVVPSVGLVPESKVLGVLFELYELPTDEDYGLRVFLEDEAGQATYPVSFRVVGSDEYRTAWRRPANGSYRVTEYLTLDLRDFDPGDYTLCVVSTVAGASGEIQAMRPLRIR